MLHTYTQVDKTEREIYKILTGRIQQVFQDSDCPKLPKSTSCSHQGTAIRMTKRTLIKKKKTTLTTT